MHSQPESCRSRLRGWWWAPLVVLVSCPEGNPPPVAPDAGQPDAGQPDAGHPDGGNPASTLTGISVEPATLTIPQADGPQGPLHALGAFSDGSSQDLTSLVEWQSSSEMVVQVDSAGYLRTGVPGQATVTATYESFSGSAEITVGPRVLVSILITPANPTVSVGGTLQLKALGEYSVHGFFIDLTDGVSWSSSDPSIASVDDLNSPGLLTGVDAGTAVIKATFPSPDYPGQILTGTATATVTN